MKRIKIGELIAGLGMGVITFTGVTTIYHFSNGAIFSNAGTPSLSIPSNPPAGATGVTMFGGLTGGFGGFGIEVFCIHGSTTYYYDGLYGWDGTPQYFTLAPSITACGSLTFALYGGGGGGSTVIQSTGGSGGLTTGVIPTKSLSSNTLTIIVAGGGQIESGGGGSFVCSGTQCSMSTVLLAAGGGGGGMYYNGGDGGGGNQPGQSGAVGCGSTPQGGTLTAGGRGGVCGGPLLSYNNGIGGAGGGAGNEYNGQGTPFGKGGGIDEAPGGYGGGGAGEGAEGAGGGGGYYGGGAENNYNNSGGSGAGGSGYCAPIVQNCGGQTGGANNGGLAALGGPGKVIISW